MDGNKSFLNALLGPKPGWALTIVLWFWILGSMVPPDKITFFFFQEQWLHNEGFDLMVSNKWSEFKERFNAQSYSLDK
jgi:hypothetical protein